MRGACSHQPGAGQSWGSRQGHRISGAPPLTTLPPCRRCPCLRADGASHRRLVRGLNNLEVPTRVWFRGSSSLQAAATSERALCPAFHCACPPSSKSIMASVCDHLRPALPGVVPASPRGSDRFCSSLGLVLGWKADRDFSSASVHRASPGHFAVTSAAPVGLASDGVCSGAPVGLRELQLV